MPTEARTPDWLVVGLGNPGSKYERTRHNLGFMLVDLLANRMQAHIARAECRSLVGRGRIDNLAVDLAKPQTFMNLSGEAVQCLVAKERRSLDRLIVVSDDVVIPFGTIRTRPKGSHGGQNGLRSIIDRLKTQEFIRLRIGIRPDHLVADVSRFVLEGFNKKETETLEEILERAADAVETIVRDGVDAAMAKFN